MTDFKTKLEMANKWLTNAIESLDNLPTEAVIADLIEAVESIDSYYKDWCDEMDEDNGDEIGTAYENSAYIEFYIEADWWHKVSLALRKIKEQRNKNGVQS